MKKVLVILLFSGGCLGGILPNITMAASNQANFSVAVLPHKSSDTINDFDLSVLSSPKEIKKMCYGIVK